MHEIQKTDYWFAKSTRIPFLAPVYLASGGTTTRIAHVATSNHDQDARLGREKGFIYLVCKNQAKPPNRFPSEKFPPFTLQVCEIFTVVDQHGG